MESEGYEEFKEDEENPYEYQEQDNFAGLGASVGERPAFSDDSFKYAKSMSKSPYMDSILDHIQCSAITNRYKETLYACIYSLLTEERVFAYNDVKKGKFSNSNPLEVKYLRAKIALQKCRCQATKYDMLILDIPGIENQILSVFEDYISRTVGPKKERILNPELPTRNTNVNEVHNVRSDIDQPKKKGFFGFGGK